MAITSWTGVTSTSAANVWNGPVWASGLNMFVASNGGGGTGTDRVATSVDGTTWVIQTTPDQTSDAISYSADAGLLIVGGTNVYMTSPNGTAWTSRSAPDANTWSYAAYAPSLNLWAFVGGATTSRIATSASGTASWTLRTTSNVNYRDIAWSPTLSKFVIVGASSVATSPDGTTWTPGTIGAYSWYNVIWSPNTSQFIAIDYNGPRIATSPDGTTWTDFAFTTTADNGFAFTWADDISTGVIVTSNFGVNTNFTESTNLTSFPAEAAITAPFGTVDATFNGKGAYSPTLNKVVFVTQNSTYDFLIASYTAMAEDTFWYKSDIPGLESAVDATIVSGASARPNGPRGQIIVSPFTATRPLYGFPSHAVAVNNRMIYAAGDYTVATDLPPIRTWNGTSDYLLARVPRDGSGNVPKTINTIINGDGNIYLGTWDYGTSSADVAGRILKLDPNSGQLTNVGNVNSLTGYIPQALCFHNGELWVGLGRSDTTAGRIYRIKPAEQTTWTLDRDMTTDSVGGCTAIVSYKGQMYFGSSAASGTFAKFGSRTSSGTYGLLYTGTGGTAADYNGFYAAVVFGDNLYFSYWNPDATEISLIKKYDGSTVTTAFNVASVDDLPIIGLFVHDGVLYAIGSRVTGGTTYESVLLTSVDGTTWVDRTGDLPLGTFSSRGLTNAFATIAY